ncbi:MAG: twin arginine-targeting protein translocase TatC [Chloroflexi bacterium RBG_19FT_COMBO_47_9]|nr:MAG: twin arginine-targeting protein translocase TatC [Chloroflexi bacterium RBG_19FT_COMBO_47_9]
MRRLFKTLWRIITAPFRFVGWIVRSTVAALRAATRNVASFFNDEEIDDTPIGETLSNTIENPSALLPHINALRKHLLRALLAIIITTAVSFLFVREILSYLAGPMSGGIQDLVAIDVTENIGTVMRVTLLSGFTIALPYIIFEIWLFIAPALKVSSRVKGLMAIPAAILLFVGGMAFAFFVMLPTALPFLFNFMGLTTQPRPSSYYNFVTTIMFWIGVTFEFPLAMYLLANLGLIKAKALASQWRLAIVIIAVLAAAITPTVDPVNMGLVMAPMIVLYFVSIGLAYIAQRNRKTEQKEALDKV